MNTHGDKERQSVYLAGPMRGYPEYNFPAFHAAAAKLRGHGLEVWSPAENDVHADGFDPTKEGSHAPLRHYMKRDLPAVLNADMVCVLPGWEKSQGAQLEVHVARTCGIPVYWADTLQSVTFSSDERNLLPGLREALLWKPNTPQLENAMTYAWESALKSFIRSIENAAPQVSQSKPQGGNGESTTADREPAAPASASPADEPSDDCRRCGCWSRSTGCCKSAHPEGTSREPSEETLREHAELLANKSLLAKREIEWRASVLAKAWLARSAITPPLGENEEPLREMCFNYRNAHPAHAEKYFQRIVRWMGQQAARSSVARSEGGKS